MFELVLRIFGIIVTLPAVAFFGYWGVYRMVLFIGQEKAWLAQLQGGDTLPLLRGYISLGLAVFGIVIALYLLKSLVKDD